MPEFIILFTDHIPVPTPLQLAGLELEAADVADRIVLIRVGSTVSRHYSGTT